MYKVLLVDDEPMIREGLRTLLEWESLGYEVVDTAANGKDALLKCEQHELDLIIVDIRMPEMNGLELIKTIRENGGTMHVLILSGYADFEYAKQAIVQRIDGYLLKPVDEDELMDYLNALKKELDHEYEARRKQQDMRQGNVEEELKQLLAEGSAEGSPTQLPGSLDGKEYELLLIKTHERSEEDRAGHTTQIKRKLSEGLEQSGAGLVLVMEPYLLILLGKSLENERFRREVYAIIAGACENLASDFTVVTGARAAGYADIRAAYQKALVRMKHRFFLESGTIMREDLELPVGSEDTRPDLLGIAEKLYLALDIVNRDAIRQLIEETAEAMRAIGYGEAEIKAAFVELVSAVLDKLSSKRPELPVRDYRMRIPELYREYRFSSLIGRVTAIMEEIADSLDNSSADKQIKRMIDLIHRNYKENLKMETLAELFNYNSAYLGKLFKQVTGENFNTYLDKVRMEQAKLLLEQGLKVYQVAEMVGYANVDYFHSKFRKYVGSSPSVYRKKES
ncbi:response regulator transcription factor [Paenibacillus glycanilyticus]|uniref:response regulator transcription factor n=1 Tax=Paenibacillus glycanilyticus TaxID=126569 RepID=UPI0020426343|nr:response regulator transcription factor [Paenibacillus glycanilyticus]MCM3627000.1 response regulator transcription factor [Paenibacillus glycanilyticus]